MPFPVNSGDARIRPLASLFANENGAGKTGLPIGSKPILPRTPTPSRLTENLPFSSTGTFVRRAILETVPPSSQVPRQRKRIPIRLWDGVRMTRRWPWEVSPTKGPWWLWWTAAAGAVHMAAAAMVSNAMYLRMVIR
jgi:hypothetical protein